MMILFEIFLIFVFYGGSIALIIWVLVKTELGSILIDKLKELMDKLKELLGQNPVKSQNNREARDPVTPWRNEVNRLQQEVEQLKQQIQQLRHRLTEWQNSSSRLEELNNRLEQENESLRNMLEHRSPSAPKQPTAQPVVHADTPKADMPTLCYAYSASSTQPYGFLSSDFSTQADLQPFVVRRLSATQAELSLHEGNSEAVSQLLRTLTYFSKLLDFTKNDDRPAQGLTMTAPGLLHLTGNVWTVEKKLQIKVI